MIPSQFPSFIIVGITSAGARFRPSDWAERLAGTLSTINHDRRMIYSPHVHPGLQDDIPCVLVNAAIRAEHPLAYEFLGNFARDNDLKILPWDPASM